MHPTLTEYIQDVCAAAAVVVFVIGFTMFAAGVTA